MFIHLNLYAVHNYISKDHMILSPQDNLLGEWITAAPTSLWSNSYRVVILENKGEAFIIVVFLNTTKIKLKSPEIAESQLDLMFGLFIWEKKLPLK